MQYDLWQEITVQSAGEHFMYCETVDDHRVIMQKDGECWQIIRFRGSERTEEYEDIQDCYDIYELHDLAKQSLPTRAEHTYCLDITTQGGVYHLDLSQSAGTLWFAPLDKLSSSPVQTPEYDIHTDLVDQMNFQFPLSLEDVYTAGLQIFSAHRYLMQQGN